MNETRKWIIHRISAIILAPLYVWFYFSLITLSTKNYSEAIYFFNDPLFEIKTANISGIIVIISSLVLTIIFWLFSRGFI